MIVVIGKCSDTCASRLTAFYLLLYSSKYSLAKLLNKINHPGHRAHELENQMEITEKTKVIDILNEYGDIAEVMAAMGIKPVGKLSLRRFVGRFISVRTAARVHRVPLDDFLLKLRTAVAGIG